MSLELHHITRKFPGVTALDDLSLGFHPGEVHALCGENGAGKSTLINILSGNLQPTAGTMHLDGAPLLLENP
ncbi:MAG TPA: ATP-binding cassette domain-containing protein, partial [Puia sp.]